MSEEKVFPKCYLTLEVQLRLFFERGVAASDKERGGRDKGVVYCWALEMEEAESFYLGRSYSQPTQCIRPVLMQS